jgi:hypothetical protein
VDRELDSLLSEYKVEPADIALFTRILTSASDFRHPNATLIAVRRVAMLMAIVLTGFLLGNIQGQKMNTVAGANAQPPQSTAYAEQMIFGPSSMDQISLR